MQVLDFQILDFIQTYLKNDIFDTVLPIITSLGNGGMLWIVIGVVCLVFANTRKMGFQMLLAMAFGFLVGNMGLKLLIARERPYTFVDGFELLIKEPSDYSFPSGHTLSSFSAALTIVQYYKGAGIAAIVLATIIAFSRLYLYVHFPSDVIAGFLLALLMVWLAKYVIQKIYHSKEKNILEE